MSGGTLFDLPGMPDTSAEDAAAAAAHRKILLGRHPLSTDTIERRLPLHPDASDVPGEPGRGPQCAQCTFALRRSSGWRCDHPAIARHDMAHLPRRLNILWPACTHFSPRL
jgi:hypothetical protein